jgi:hypothetical protein
LKLIPWAEAALVAQGVSRSPVRAAHSTMGTVYYANSLGRLAGSGTRSPQPVAAGGGGWEVGAPIEGTGTAAGTSTAAGGAAAGGAVTGGVAVGTQAAGATQHSADVATSSGGPRVPIGDASPRRPSPPRRDDPGRSDVASGSHLDASAPEDG